MNNGGRVEFTVTGPTFAALAEAAESKLTALIPQDQPREFFFTYRLDVRPAVSAGDGSTLTWEAEVFADVDRTHSG